MAAAAAVAKRYILNLNYYFMLIIFRYVKNRSKFATLVSSLEFMSNSFFAEALDMVLITALGYVLYFVKVVSKHQK